MNPRRFAVLIVVLACLTACNRESTETPEPKTAPAPEATPPLPMAEPLLQPRTMQLAQSGWRFELKLFPDGQGGEAFEGWARSAEGREVTLSNPAQGEALAEAFATDLDSDGRPELLLWWQSTGSSAEGTVRGWRFDDEGGSIALLLPELDSDSALGYRGRDQFGIQGAMLVRSFPVYREDDDNATPTSGFLRIIRYALVQGSFEVASLSLEPAAGSPQDELLGG
jgi:hypothetical protein